MDWSHASRTGFFNVVDQVWDYPAIEWAGFMPESLPRLVPPGSVIGNVASSTAQLWGLGNDVPVISAGHDHFCGAFGAGVRASGQAYLSAGTSEAHLILCDTAPPEALADPDIDVGCYVDGKRFYVHRNLLAGQLYRQWLQRLGQADDVEFQQKMAGVDPGSGGTKVIISPRSAAAEILDAPPNASNELMMRALQEGIALAAANVTKTLAAASGLSITSSLAAGPPTQQQLWRELRIGLSETDYHFVEQQETTAMGAALLAQHAVTGTADFPVRTMQIPPLTEFQTASYRKLKHSYESVPRRETPVHVTR
jgi:xylulokinase